MTRLRSERAWLLLAAVIATAWGPLARAQAEAPEVLAEVVLLSDAEQLQRGLLAFHDGEYDVCLVVLGQVDPMELGRDQRIQLHEMMGKASYFQSDMDAARVQFFEVLKLEPAYEMDPVSTPRQIIEVYEDVRTVHEKDLAKFPVEPERTIPGRNNPKVATSNMFVAFAPAGVFRLLFLRTPGKGWAMLLGGQVAPIGLSVGSYLYLNWAYDKCNFVAVANAVGVFRVVNVITGIVGWVVYAVGIVDAFLSQGYHRPASGGAGRRKVAAGWRWGPPIAPPLWAPD
jgi:hypothetical protein